MTNLEDDVALLERGLREFDSVEIETVGSFALFTARP